MARWAVASSHPVVASEPRLRTPPPNPASEPRLRPLAQHHPNHMAPCEVG